MERETHTIDAEGKTLGRLATKVAKLLQGKHKPSYLPNKDMGDAVKIENAAEIELTGNKEKQKKYYNYSGYPGGLKEQSLQTIRKKNPERIIKDAVAGMIPKNKLHEQRIKRLTIET
jgi:large subunit ribosomal protein L13